MRHKIEIDGVEVTFSENETILEVAQRHEKEIPTLCYDPRLEPFGGCRLCIVELEGARNPVASCTTKATPGMVVRTATDTIEAYRKTLLEMVISENREVDVSPLRGYAAGELADLRDKYAINGNCMTGAKSGTNKTDENPFILRDYELCISCYRCVRVCAEQEGDHAINIMNRGFHTQITTEFDGLLKDSACTFCGQCIQTCPTGALADKKALRAADEVADAIPDKTRTICPYCGVGCSVDILTKNEKIVGIHPAMDGPANQGALCVKGQFAYDFVQHSDRLKTPLIRGDDGELHEATWEDALDKAAEGFRQVNAEHGRHSIYGIASGRAPSEAAYLMQKFIRVGFGTNYIDNCSRA
ncbi:molybdopterin-dependent oxidoreductase [Candidatus Poribacteria bacterium]|nr:molybdopterin-dependent oxidoreductase [Candidatus Poribacteria bacterium]MYH80762.1 molybdopterin-dependent oxidoreductase [Candidatus Poribacteria bacterium]MYK95935.1 molybdopterin-dependent oxidoreductase [Candidatus Poribacteria bacterium]